MSDPPIQKKTSDVSRHKEDASTAKNRDIWHDIALKGSTSNLYPHIGNDLPDMDKGLSSPAPGHQHRSKRKYSVHQNQAKALENLTNQGGFPSLCKHELLTLKKLKKKKRMKMKMTMFHL